MKRNLIFTLVLFAITCCAFGQIHNCQIKIIRLQFDETIKENSEKRNDNLLASAKPTDSVLVYNTDIKKLEIKIDSGCCTYLGQTYLTSHQYALKKEAVARLLTLPIPLCCGIPIAVYIDEKEIYRAMLWNSVSSFGNKTITAILIGDIFTVVNQLPTISDLGNNGLANKKNLIDCLFKTNSAKE